YNRTGGSASRAANQRTVAPETVTAQAALVTCGVDDRSATQSVGERSPNSAPLCLAAVCFRKFPHRATPCGPQPALRLPPGLLGDQKKTLLRPGSSQNAQFPGNA